MALQDERTRIVDYVPKSTLAGDLAVLRAMWFGVSHRLAGEGSGGDAHQQMLEKFYKDQAGLYDTYRCRMLHGRFPMMREVTMRSPAKGAVWVDLGGGTGSNIEFYGAELAAKFAKVVIVDLCPSLAAQARDRVQKKGLGGVVTVVCGDATDFALQGLPAAGTADAVTFSYALSMIPPWRKAIENALRLLKPGGTLGVADFTVSKARQLAPVRYFWTTMFASDHVHLSEAHRDHLAAVCDTDIVNVGFGSFPYVPPCVRAAYYMFVGRKKMPLTRAEVAKHATPEDAWVIIEGKVYALSDYLSEHPGGKALFKHAGGDATKGFNGPQHPDTVWDVLPTYYVGDLEGE